MNITKAIKAVRSALTPDARDFPSAGGGTAWLTTYASAKPTDAWTLVLPRGSGERSSHVAERLAESGGTHAAVLAAPRAPGRTLAHEVADAKKAVLLCREKGATRISVYGEGDGALAALALAAILPDIALVTAAARLSPELGSSFSGGQNVASVAAHLDGYKGRLLLVREGDGAGHDPAALKALEAAIPQRERFEMMTLDGVSDGFSKVDGKDSARATDKVAELIARALAGTPLPGGVLTVEHEDASQDRAERGQAADAWAKDLIARNGATDAFVTDPDDDGHRDIASGVAKRR